MASAAATAQLVERFDGLGRDVSAGKASRTGDELSGSRTHAFCARASSDGLEDGEFFESENQRRFLAAPYLGLRTMRSKPLTLHGRCNVDRDSSQTVCGESRQSRLPASGRTSAGES